MSQWRKNKYSPSSAAIKKIEEYFEIKLELAQDKKTPDDVKVTGREAKILEALNAKTPEEQKAFLIFLGLDPDLE